MGGDKVEFHRGGFLPEQKKRRVKEREFFLNEEKEIHKSDTNDDDEEGWGVGGVK